MMRQKGIMGAVGADKIRKIMADIKTVKIQGARNVAIAGVRILKIKAECSTAKSSREFLSELRELSKKVLALRPTEPALRFSMELILSKAGLRVKSPPRELKVYTSVLCAHYIKETHEKLKRIAENGVNSIVSGDVIMTHCHSNCVMQVLKAAKRQGKSFSVIVTETRPLYQGNITARELLKEKIEVIYCVDSACAAMMKKTTKVLVGADAITADGSVVSKIGTCQMAIVAREYKVPFVVVCGTHKFDQRTADGHPEPIEMREAKEIINPRKIRGAKIMNPAFDVTPKEYIHEIVTEIGAYSPETLIGLLESKKGRTGG